MTIDINFKLNLTAVSYSLHLGKKSIKGKLLSSILGIDFLSNTAENILIHIFLNLLLFWKSIHLCWYPSVILTEILIRNNISDFN